MIALLLIFCCVCLRKNWEIGQMFDEDTDVMMAFFLVHPNM